MTKRRALFPVLKPIDMAYSFMFECDPDGGLTHYVMAGEDSPF